MCTDPHIHTHLRTLRAFSFPSHSKEAVGIICAHSSAVLSLIQSDSFLCDCQLHWLPTWLVTRALQDGVSATCAHPESLKGTSIFLAPSSSFVCGESRVRFICVNVGRLVQNVLLLCGYFRELCIYTQTCL